MSNLKHWIWLTQRRGLAGQEAVRVLNHFGTPEQVFFADEEAYVLLGGLKPETVRSLMDKSLDRADRVLGDCERLGIRPLTMQDAAYPGRLRAIALPPWGGGAGRRHRRGVPQISWRAV